MRLKPQAVGLKIEDKIDWALRHEIRDAITLVTKNIYGRAISKAVNEVTHQLTEHPRWWAEYWALRGDDIGRY